MLKFYFKIALVFIINIFLVYKVYAENISEIKIYGNDRISTQTIILFSEAKINDEVDENILNFYLKNLYETNYFKNIEIKLENSILSIFVEEEPLIQSVKFQGLRAKKFIEPLKNSIKLKDRSSFKESIFLEDKKNITNTLRSMGYYFSKVSGSIEDLGDNKINLIYDVKLGEKAKISKITFTGNKIYKDKKLRNIIISEEYKFWKIISGKKYLNEELINVDKKLLRNFYLNNGFYDVKINSSFAKLINKNEFELIFNIDSNQKFFFNELDLIVSNDYSRNNFNKIFKLFEKLKGQPYSINDIDNILDLIDEIVISKQFESINSTVNEKIENNKINLLFEVKETEKFLVDRINIYGNNVTEEKVIRNQLLIDEGDPYNEILKAKSINNIKSLNFFKEVQSDVLDSADNKKIINISVEEKPTGEITAGAGFGTEGSTIAFGVKENNFLGKGISLNSNLKLSEEDVKGNFTVTNPNFRNSDKSIFFNIQALETDKMTKSGYKTNKTGFKIGTEFEYFEDLNLGIGKSSYYEKISTDSTASARQQKQKGNYWDTFVSLNFTLDKRNQKFQTSKGYVSRFDVDVPIISDTNSISNKFLYKYFTELFNENISSIGLTLGSTFSLKNEDVKLSERLFIPGKKLRGFESGKVGPKDGDDFIGGNYLFTFNISSTIPQILPNSQDTDFSVFLDVAHLWGVDYDSSIDGDGKIRSSIGLGLDWFTVIGPLNFTYAIPVSKDVNDVTQEFSFNLGTTF